MRRSLIASTALLLAATPLHAAEEGGGGLLSVNPGLTIWTIIIFLIVLAILSRAAYPKILGAVEAREAHIARLTEEAERDRAEAAALAAENRQLVEETRARVHGAVEEARGQAEKMRAEMMDAATRERQEMLDRARRELDAALHLWTEVGAPYEAALARMGLAEAYRRNNSGNYAEASEFFTSLLRSDTDTGNQAEALVNDALPAGTPLIVGYGIITPRGEELGVVNTEMEGVALTALLPLITLITDSGSAPALGNNAVRDTVSRLERPKTCRLSSRS